LKTDLKRANDPRIGVTAGYQHLGAEPLLKAADVVSAKVETLLAGADNMVELKPKLRPRSP
jgi:hypothetical protein